MFRNQSEKSSGRIDNCYCKGLSCRR